MPPTPNSPVAASSSRNRRERAGLLLAMALITALLAASRGDSWRDLEASERANLQSQARAIDDALQRQLVAVRAALLGVRADIVRVSPEGRRLFAELRLKALADAMPGARSMHLLDAQGRLWASSVPALVGRDLSKVDYVRNIVSRPQPDRLYLSRPFVTPSGAYTVILSMALFGSDGSFDGIATAALEPDHLRTLIAGTLYASDMSGLVMHAGTGQVVLQHPEPAAGEETGGNLLAPGSPLQRHLQSGLQAQLLSAALPASSGQPGPQRLFALRTVQPAALQMDQALVLALSRDLDVLFAPWWFDTAVAALLLLLLLAAGWIALVVVQRRRSQSESLALAGAARQAADNERLQLALSGGDLALWDARVPSGESIVNERWHTMLGYSSADHDAGAERWRALLHPDDRDRVVALQQAHVDGRTPGYEAIYRLRHRQGHWIWVLDRGRVVERDADGRALRMVGTHMDISERMQAEQALRDSEAQLAELTAALPGPVARLDRDGCYLFSNAACEQWFGRSHQEVQGRRWQEFNPPDVQQVVEPQMALVLQGQTRTFDLTLPTVTGPRASIVTLVPDREPAGSVRGCFVVVTDISQHKRTEDALRRSQDELRMASRLARVGSWHRDLDSGVVTLGEELAALLGLPADPMLTVAEGFRFVAPESQAQLAEHVRRCREHGQPFSVEIGAVGAGQRALRMRLLGEAVRDAGGRIVALQGAAQDITEAHAAAQHLQRLETERLALERQLREAQKMESIGTLAGGIAHDFNNILPAILGNVALARAELPDLPQSQAALQSLDQINAAALRARSLVQQILTFSRRRPSALQPQPLGPVVEETLALLRATLPATVRLDQRLAEETLVVEADATQLQQVLMNLCTNAWHALPAGQGRIEVGLEACTTAARAGLDLNGMGPGPCVHLWVSDNGCGMDAATLQRIFDPFFTTKPVGHGTGLGLSVVHGIVRAHQGSISVDSEPGVGTVFHVYLPRQALPEVPVAAAGDLPPGAAHGGGEQLLYVDDDEVMLLLVQRLLERDGYKVLTCASAAQALALLGEASQRFDLVVTDFNMPEMSGLDLLRALADLRPGLPVIISSGYLTDHLRSEAKAAGVRALLRKENTLEKLPALVHKVLSENAVKAAG